jgi:hypothetical protein
VACALDLTGELALAARAVAGLAARLDLAGFSDETAQGIDVLIVKAAALRAVNLCAAAAARAAPAWATGWGRITTFFFFDFFFDIVLLGVASLVRHPEHTPHSLLRSVCRLIGLLQV